MPSIRDAMIATAPPYLKDGDGLRLLWTIGSMLDAQVDWTHHGIRARFPSYLSDDVLAEIGKDRLITRGAFENPETYAGRLRQWLDTWLLAGNPFAIMRQLRAYLAPYEVPMRIVNHWGSWYTLNADGTTEFKLNANNWDWDSLVVPWPAPAWSRFWVILYPPAALWTRLPDIGDPELWGDAIGSPGFTIGSTATPEEVASVRQIVRTWKDEKSRCEKIIVSFETSPDPFDPDIVVAPGTWTNTSRVTGGTNGFGGTRALTRPVNGGGLNSAVYWQGTGGING